MNENIQVNVESIKDKVIANIGQNKKISIFTLGCKVNQYESEAMAEQFKASGYEIVDYEEFCDYYVINTCTVTSISDRKSRQFMRRAKKNNPKAVIVVVGCYSQVAPEQVEAIEEVNLVLGTNEKKDIVQYIQGVTSDSKVVHVQEIMKVREYDELEIEDTHDKTRVFMKIQDGCNQFCSYCIIPYARGPIRSRKPENVINEAKRLAKKGFKEIVLTGIHLTSYGLDLKTTSLIEIIESLNEIEGLERIRLGSLEPKIITEEFINRITKIDKFCPHFHLSLQSGSDDVLKRMNRKYNSSDYLTGVERIRTAYPMAGITTDIIVGFPGETDEHFEETLNYVKKIKFSQVHVFKYSQRENTPAAVMIDQIHGTAKTARSHRLEAVVNSLEKAYYHQYLGSDVEVLFEEVKDGYYEGYTTSYLRVKVKSSENLLHEIRKVKIINTESKKLVGKLMNS